MMREAILYERFDRSDRLQCNVCQWRCRVNLGRLGRCRVRENRDGKLYALSYGRVAAAHDDPIEKKPLFHFYPGSRVFSLGSWGCNFRCVHCQNWRIAYAEPVLESSGWRVPGACLEIGTLMLPEQAVEAALRSGCAGICWTYNEPAVWLEYTLECARLAKEAGLYTAYVTNGYLTPAALDALGPHLDAYRVDFKGFSDKFYRRLAKLPHWREMLDVTCRAKHKWGMHVEVVTNIIPTLNDDEQLAGIAEWVEANLGAVTPWHVTAFHPDAQLRDIPVTPPSTMLRARSIGLEAGLRFVYTGNLPGIGGEDTLCYRCGNKAIERAGYRTRVTGLTDEGRCSSCGADLGVRKSYALASR